MDYLAIIFFLAFGISAFLILKNKEHRKTFFVTAGILLLLSGLFIQRIGSAGDYHDGPYLNYRLEFLGFTISSRWNNGEKLDSENSILYGWPAGYAKKPLDYLGAENIKFELDGTIFNLLFITIVASLLAWVIDYFRKLHKTST